jgi:hypothetical protein
MVAETAYVLPLAVVATVAYSLSVVVETQDVELVVRHIPVDIYVINNFL